MDIVDNLTVSSTEIACTEHINVVIETNSSTKRKNIKFNVPAPKQGVSFRAKGPWESTTNYINNEFYIDIVNKFGCSYYCKISNTNKEPVASADSEYWGLMADKGTSVIIVDNLNSDHTDYVLSARQGKVLKTENDNQTIEINKIKNNTAIIANSDGGFSCGSGATIGKGIQFKGYTICDENGKIPVARLFDAIYPVDSIYISTSSTNPGTLFGGTWEAYAQGRTIIGEGTSDREFAEGTIGGSSTHTLSINEMPSHTHTQNAHNHSGNQKDFYFWFNQFQHSSKNQPENTFANNGCFNNAENNNVTLSQDDWKNDTDAIGSGSRWGHRKVGVHWNHQPSINNTTAINNNTGEGQAHNNLPPYIVTYIWRRIA